MPKITVFNGQQIELRHQSLDGPRLIPGLQLLGVIAADIQSFRFTIGAGSGDGKFHQDRISEVVNATHGGSILIDVAQESWNSKEGGIPSKEKPATRTFYLLTPQMMLTTETSQTRVLTPRK